MPEPDPLRAIKTPWSSATPPSGAVPGDVPPIPIPDHTLIRRIGKGSYGEVWLARNALGVYRAVKIIDRRAFDDDRPFEREFAGMQRFEPVSRSHESQLNILQVGRGPDCFYYVMELADDMGRGATIDEASYTPRNLRSELLIRGRLPVDECVRLGLALTTALENLHRHGLVHRDIKPSNIVFVNGIPKLADIGLVARAEATMSFVGTQGYLPPEGPGTVQADLFSLGKVLYEISTGRDRQQFPELPTGITELPDRAALAELNEVLLRACAPDVKQRYESAAEMHADLALLQSGKSVARMRAVERRLRFVQRAGVLVTIVAVIAAGLYLWQSRQARQMKTLATEARHNELVARENLYAADINLAHQAVIADNLRQARVLLQNHVPKPGEPDLRGFEWRYLWQQCRSDELSSLPGHERGAWRVAFSPDGTRLATGGADGTVKLWDLVSRREIAALAGTGGVQSVAFSPKGDLLATGSDDGVWLWDARTFAKIRRVPEAILQAKFSPDGTYLLTLATNGLILWETANWRITNSLKTPEPRSRMDFQAAFAPDGKRIVVVFDDAIRLFSIPDLQETGVLAQRRPKWPFISFSPDNNTLATHTTGFGVKLWDIAKQRELKILPGHADIVLAARFSPDGSRLATCSSDQTIKLWDVPTGELVHALKGQSDVVFDVAFSPDGKLLASVGYNDGAVKLWDANAKPKQESFREPFGPVGFGSEGGLIAFDKNLKTVALNPATLQANSATELGLKEGRNYFPFLGNLSPDGRTLGLWALKEQFMEVWDMRIGKLLCSVESNEPYLCFAPRRQLLTTATSNQTATVWQLPDGARKWVFTNTFQVRAISPDETLILTDEGTGWKLWKIEGEEVRSLLTFGPKRNPSSERNAWSGAAFSPDGRLAATAEENGLIKLWAMPAAREVGIFSGHTRNQIDLAFSPDGRTLASICDDRTVRLWHVATRRELLRFQALKEDQRQFALVFSPDGRALAARRFDEDGPITWVWHAPSLAEIAVAEEKH